MPQIGLDTFYLLILPQKPLLSFYSFTLISNLIIIALIVLDIANMCKLHNNICKSLLLSYLFFICYYIHEDFTKNNKILIKFERMILYENGTYLRARQRFRSFS